MGLVVLNLVAFFYKMILCYIDESGTSSIPGNSSHFVLAGISIPVEYWKSCDNDIENIKKQYLLGNVEIHVGWILRPYLEQSQITDFNKLDYNKRRTLVEQSRKKELLRLQKTHNNKQYKQTKKNFKKTQAYIHLTYQERLAFIKQLAVCVSKWGFARLFAECIDKVFFDPARRVQGESLDEQAFTQIVSRFEHYLQNISIKMTDKCYGLLIHDNNETVARKHTTLMKSYHHKGTQWTSLKCLIETPLFVDSELTSMIQIADLCAYALRRYLENGEEELFDLLIQRADRVKSQVGVRHYTADGCTCKICSHHK